MATNDLEWLGTWYGLQCNGDWEHKKGMLLESLRVPSASPYTAMHGWRLRIDLRGTTAAGLPPRRFAVCSIDDPRAQGWLCCSLNGQRFEGEGTEVEALIGVFRRWIDARPPVLEAVSTG